MKFSPSSQQSQIIMSEVNNPVIRKFTLCSYIIQRTAECSTVQYSTLVTYHSIYQVLVPVDTLVYLTTARDFVRKNSLLCL